MKARIYIGSICQETNTFNPCITDLSTFLRGHYLKGVDIPDRLRGTNTEIGGFYDVLGSVSGVAAVPGVAAWAVASGKITRDALDALTSDLMSSLEAQMPVDGVLLALHGALVCEDEDDCEGEILERVRELLGDGVPVAATLDYHTNLTDKMAQNADVLVGYRTYPHVDFRETGEKAAKLILDLIRDHRRPSFAISTLDMILPVENTETGQPPMAGAIERLEHLDRQPDVLSASIFCPHPWLDVYDTGVRVIVYGESEDNCGKYAKPIADYIWQNRAEFFREYPHIDAFLDTIDQYEKPVIVVDSGDVTSAGGAGDSTEILRALLQRAEGHKAVLSVVDAAAVHRAIEIGEGGRSEFTIGSPRHDGYNKPVSVTADVVKVTDSPVEVKGPSYSGVKLNMGARANLRVDGGISLVVSEYSSLMHDPQFLRSLGIDPETYDIIVQKSHKLFRPAYKDIAGSIVILDTPGFTDQNVKRLPFKRVRRPVYPFDDI